MVRTSTANVVQDVLHIAVVVVTEAQLGLAGHELGHADGAVAVLELANHSVLAVVVAIALVTQSCKDTNTRKTIKKFIN